MKGEEDFCETHITVIAPSSRGIFDEAPRSSGTIPSRDFLGRHRTEFQTPLPLFPSILGGREARQSVAGGREFGGSAHTSTWLSMSRGRRSRWTQGGYLTSSRVAVKASDSLPHAGSPRRSTLLVEDPDPSGR